MEEYRCLSGLELRTHRGRVLLDSFSETVQLANQDWVLHTADKRGTVSNDLHTLQLHLVSESRLKIAATDASSPICDLLIVGTIQIQHTARAGQLIRTGLFMLQKVHSNFWTISLGSM